MKLILVGILTVLSIQLSAQKKTAFNPDEKFPADSIRAWTREIMKEVSIGQPGFYRYTSKPRFDFVIDSTLQTVTDSLTTIEFYRKLKPLFAQIGCLHTSVALSEEYDNHTKKISKLIPIEVFIDERKQVFVTKNHSKDPFIPLKSQVISINGKPIVEILNTLLRAIPSDGYNQTLKTLLLNHRFAFWYQPMIELNDTFTIKVKVENEIKTYHLNGVEPEVFPSFESLESSDKEQLVFEIKDGVGFLTIRSFAKTVIKKNGQKFKKFIEETFKALSDQQIQNLVIDLRYNTGGTDTNAALLASYFFDEPFDYWEKIELTQEMAEQIKGIYRIFYSKPEKIDSSYHWKGSLLTKEFNHYNIDPAKNNYHGNTYLITNGISMSSCSDFVAILSYNGKAKVVGQESGGGYQGNTSGLMPNEDIYANMTMTVPLLKYTNAVDMNKNVGRGTIPDFIVTPTLEDWIEGRDIEMDFVKKIMENE
ncbi:MAG: S41 family peptidase [Reichenbachiella sp.]|uniref:S41 family peptidase n=1 Tax=Reichenbachiella sp. TaxID=2184521 RepID=UPI003266ABD7